MPKYRQIKAAAIKASGEFQLTGKMELLAAEGEGKEPTLYLHANTGKPMDLAGFDNPVIIDMKGAFFDKQTTPVIIDHETSRRLGHTTEQAILVNGQTKMVHGKMLRGPLIAAFAQRSSNRAEAKEVMADAQQGYPFQTSVGAKIVKGYILPEGETAEVNGKEWEGPLIVSSRTRIRELTVTVLGADNDTSAVVAAKSKERKMDEKFKAWLEALGFDDPESIDAKQVKLLKAKYTAELKAAEEEEEDDDPPAPKPKKGKGKGKTIRTRIRARERVPAGHDEDDEIEAGEDDEDDDEDDNEDRIRARRADEEDRIDAINDITAKFEDSVQEIEIGKKKMTLKAFKKRAIRDGMGADTFELHCRRADLPVLRGPGIHMIDNTISDGRALECSMLRWAGLASNGHNKKNDIKYGLESMYDEKVLDASHKRQYQINGSINKLFAIQAQAAGFNVNHMTNDDDLRAAAHQAWSRLQGYGGRSDIKANTFSSISVTNILENVMHKMAYSSFVMVESIWPFLCARRPLNDFKVHSMYRLDPNGHFRKVATDGQLKHVSMTDTKKTLQAETYGAMIVIDRKTQKNDDLALIMDKARSIGSLGALRVDEAVMILLLSNPSSFFAAGNGNLMTGGTTALSISSLQTAQQKFRDQLINGKPIAVSPSILLVGTNQEVLSNQLYNQSQMWVTTTADTPKFANNPFAGRFTPHYTGYLNNTSITDQDGVTLSNQSTTQWYLFANPNAPQGAALVIGFVDGRETPYFDEAATEFSVPGGIQMRAYFDFGVSMHITQMALRSAGA